MTSLLSPMLANALDIEDIHAKAQGYWMEPKLDGIRCLASWDGRLYSRSAKTDLAPRLPHIVNAVKQLDLPQGVWLDGEVGYVKGYQLPMTAPGWRWPILDFNATVRVTQSGVDTSLAKQKTNPKPIQFWIFDWIQSDKSQAHRSDILSKRSRRFTSTYLQVVPQEDKWDEARYDDYVLMGGEGVILKNPSATYKPGKRPAKHWYKIKKFDSFDGWIAGFDPGMGKYQGQVGALVVSHPGGFHVRCSGMSDADRLDMTNNWEKYHRKSVEVKFFGNVGATGEGIRHPQFLRMRPDLD